MEKRLIIAIVLSVLIVLGFQYMSPKQATSPLQTPAVTEPAAIIKEIVAEEPVVPIIDEKIIEIEMDNYIAAFSNIGGAVKEIKLKKFKSDGMDILNLITLTNPSEYLMTITSPAIPGLDRAIYTMQKQDDGIVCKTTIGDFQVTKTYKLHNSNYGIKLQLLLKNRSGSAKQLNYRIVGGSGLTEENDQNKRFIEVTAVIGDKTIGFKRPKPGQRITNPGLVTWTALKNKYFSLILKPFMPTNAQFYCENKDGILTMGIESEDITVAPLSIVDNNFLFYAGPSSIPELKKVGHGLDSTINYGFFGSISKLMIATLAFFHHITRNWGFAIILLAVLLNLITYPLTAKSFMSMKKMQELHPQMEKLKKEYKDNPQRLNKEMMELYKTYNINPLSGCLPMLLQMPIFIALYQALMRCIELRQAGFFWIQDLSSPDAIPLPITLPIIGNSINILPLIMVGAMVIQQKISTKTMGSAVTPEQKEQQKMMLIILPIVFGFIFYNMPSGLVLYWVVNTVLTILEQYAMTKNT